MALAASTYYLARETRKLGVFTQREVAAVEQQAKAAAEQVDFLRLGVEASSRPVVVDVREDIDSPIENVAYAGWTAKVNATAVDVSTTATHLHVSIPVRNVGVGIAFIDSVSIRAESEEWDGTPTVQAIPPSEVSRLRFSVPTAATRYASFDADVIQSGALTLEVKYSDASGHVQPVTRLSYVRAEDGAWHVDRVVLLGVWGLL